MAPHIEKAQLISKPTTRRGSSKSPSKPAKDNSKEMTQPNQEQTIPPKKLSGELPKFLVPGRKISAPECNRPPVSITYFSYFLCYLMYELAPLSFLHER